MTTKLIKSILRAFLWTGLATAVACSGHDGRGIPAEFEQQAQALVVNPVIDFAARPSYHANNLIALTFDDGPDLANTPRVLDVLKAKNVKATFFICTNNFDGPVDGNTTLKNLIKRMVAEGHQLASHTVHHYDLATLSASQIESEIVQLQTTVNRSDVLGPSFPKITMLRAPFGSPYLGGSPGQTNYDKVANVVGKYAVHMGWAIDVFDYNCTGTAAQKKACVYNNYVNKVKAIGTGDYGMVLMHSVQPQTADAIGDIIDYTRSKGFVFALGEDIVKARFGGQSSHQLIYGGGGGCSPTPFGGNARTIPGTIQAEDYDNGGQGCAYNDTTTANQGGQYRTTEGVDVQITTDSGGGYNIGYVQAGEYLDYSVNVSAAGNYKLELRTATTAAGKTVDVLIGSTVIADNVPITNTGGYQTFATVVVPSVALPAGNQRLRVLFNSASLNFNWLRLSTIASCTPETNPAFCTRLGKTCGTVSGSDNCGAPRTVGSCGNCTSPQICGSNNVCTTPCTPESNAAFCNRLGKNCGTVSGSDNCGVSRTVTSCGTCTSPAVCGAGNVCQAPSSRAYFFFEAETGTGAATAPMAIGNDTNASAGKFISSGTANSSGAVPSNGHVTFAFTVTTPGTYKVWGRFLVGPATSSDDSLWVRIDGGTFVQWNDIFPRVGNTGYRWDSERDTAAGNAVITRNLTAGSHVLEIAYRENGLKMDRFLVTDDLAFVP